MSYAIADLEKLSGVSAHNIRIWERRYQALQPARTAGNTRVYDDTQLQRLLALAALQAAGHKIAGIGRLDNAALDALLKESTVWSEEPESTAFYIHELIRLTLQYQELPISRLLDTCVGQFGLPGTCIRIIYPLLNRVGLLWLDHQLYPAHEHFLTAIIRQKMFAAIEQSTRDTAPAAAHWLLFLPEDEEHDIGLLLASYLLRSAGHRVTYLGGRLPLDALAMALESLKPDRLLFLMTRIRPLADAQRYVHQVGLMTTGMRCYLSGHPKTTSHLSYPSNIVRLSDPAEFQQLLAEKT